MAGTTAELITVVPGDGRYPDLTRGTNQRWSSSPKRIYLPRTTEEVRAALDAALELDAAGAITVSSSGHCYEAFVHNDQVQVVIDMSACTDVYFDERHRAFSVAAGASNLNIYEALYKQWGVTIPAGSCAQVSAGGHISGGGYGLSSRQLGLTVDYVYGVEVVVPDRDTGRAQAVVATRDDTDPALQDLWWAHTGGGGGNFGILTRFLLRSPDVNPRAEPRLLLPPAPSQVWVHAMSWPWDRMGEQEFATLVRNFGEWHAANSDVNSPYARLFSLLKLTHHANGQLSVVTQIDAGPTDPHEPSALEMLLSFLRDLNRGINVDTEPMTTRAGEHAALPQFADPRLLPWFTATTYLSGSNPTLRGKYKSAHMRRPFPDGQIAAIHRNLTTDITEGYANSNALLQVDSYGCRVNAVPWDATAVPQRTSIMKLQYQTYWTSAVDTGEPQPEDAAHLEWIRTFYSDVYGRPGVPVPDDVTDGCYVNYPDVDLNDPTWNRSPHEWSALYYKGNYDRLRRARARWDPRPVLYRHSQSVEP